MRGSWGKRDVMVLINSEGRMNQGVEETIQGVSTSEESVISPSMMGPVISVSSSAGWLGSGLFAGSSVSVGHLFPSTPALDDPHRFPRPMLSFGPTKRPPFFPILYHHYSRLCPSSSSGHPKRSCCVPCRKLLQIVWELLRWGAKCTWVNGMGATDLEALCRGSVPFSGCGVQVHIRTPNAW